MIQMGINKCVVCGTYIPEGRHVCKECAVENGVEERDTHDIYDDELVTFEKFKSKKNRPVIENTHVRDGKHKSKLKK